jgi:hypothetical protein
MVREREILDLQFLQDSVATDGNINERAAELFDTKAKKVSVFNTAAKRLADGSNKPKTKRTIKTNTTGAKKQAINNTATIKRTKGKRLKKKQRVVSLANDSDDNPSASDKDATAIADLPNPGNDSGNDPSSSDEDATVIIDLPYSGKKARVRKPEALQLESAAYRGIKGLEYN